MMGVSRSDAMDMDLWEYEARLWNWNEVHSTADVEPPDPEMTQRLIEKLNSGMLN